LFLFSVVVTSLDDSLLKMTFSAFHCEMLICLGPTQEFGLVSSEITVRHPCFETGYFNCVISSKPGASYLEVTLKKMVHAFITAMPF